MKVQARWIKQKITQPLDWESFFPPRIRGDSSTKSFGNHQLLLVITINVKTSIKCQPQASFHPSIHSRTTKNPSLSEGSGLLSSSDDFGTGIAPGIWRSKTFKNTEKRRNDRNLKNNMIPLRKRKNIETKNTLFQVHLRFVRGCKHPSFSECKSWICWKDFAFFGTQDSLRFIFYLGSIPRVGLYHIEFKVWYWNNWAYQHKSGYHELTKTWRYAILSALHWWELPSSPNILNHGVKHKTTKLH